MAETKKAPNWGMLALCFCAQLSLYVPYYAHSTQTGYLMDTFGMN